MEPRDEQPRRGPAWRAAEEFGIDMPALEANLRLTVEERLMAHRRALATIEALREANRKRNV